MMTESSLINRIDRQEIGILREFTSQVPVRVGALAKELGLRVVLATLPMNISGLIQPDEGGGFVIKVNRFESKERQRFTIAHEIAHYLLHRDRINSGIVDSVLYRSKLSSRLEAEANKLAAEIIMPARVLREELNRFGGRIPEDAIAELAVRFGVSKQAMAIRAG